MSRYIDADELRSFIKGQYFKCDMPEEWGNGVMWATSQINRYCNKVAPSIDIVRCAECVYCNIQNTKYLYAICERHGIEFKPFEDDTRTHFCAWGIKADRKTENSSEKPNNCEECKHWNDTEDDCADRHGCRTTTEDWQDWKDKMWAEAIVTEPTTEDCSTVPTSSKMEQVDEPQTCSVNGRPYTECCNCEYHKCTADEPQYEMGMGTLKCDNCSEYGSFKCTKCDGEMYFKRLEPKDEPQTE